ncbi:D-glycerate dehydrogenase [Robbsia sp. Bb-Pol-6]|uniref:D-glycerate dehydrogenase n=1 Tax=Robbsia betulipollinis TaxID=2981849 RepID=A0ABT3ZSK2_9BURK|nr:D-glycerate dehydrogenase [Robbsia betulipollinis]MCY0389534.1 D-glycerate dehydrogenase [Robbsia betulipollinis]
MKPLRIVVYKALPADVEARLAEHAELVPVAADALHSSDARTADAARAALADALADADGAIGSSVTIDAALLARATRLAVLSTVSVGVDKFDLDDLTRRGIVLTHTPDVLTETTADAVFALMLASARRVVEMAELIRQGRWQASIGPAQYGVDVHHKTIGIVGFGRIGQAVARRAALGFGMQVLYTGPRPVPQAESAYGAVRVELDALLARADFVCLQAPLTPATRHMIGAAELARMKPEAILINAGRGALVDETALVAALREGRIRGAGLDVFETEPLPGDAPLARLPNVVALPHIGSATLDTRHAMARNAADNLLAALDGARPQNVANPAVLARRRPVTRAR